MKVLVYGSGVIGGIEEDDIYDAVFIVMPYNRMQAILEPQAIR